MYTSGLKNTTKESSSTCRGELLEFLYKILVLCITIVYKILHKSLVLRVEEGVVSVTILESSSAYSL